MVGTIMPQNPAKHDRTAGEHLAEDWQLFQQVEEGAAHYLSRLWEVHTPAVVLGRFGTAAEEVFEARCERDGVPVVRRFSGGGAVVLGPGCLNFSAVFALPRHAEFMDVSRSFKLVLGRIAAALAVEGVTIEGGTDLAIGGRKVSGNAQRRGRRALIHHGTLLYDFDPMLAARYLREPGRQPGYRRRRPHHDFIGAVRVPRDLLSERLSIALADAAAFAAGPWMHA
jgi:lipoate---protein ligase